MKLKLSVLTLAGLAAVSVSHSIAAQELQPLTPEPAPAVTDGQLIDGTPSLWFVEFSGPPLAGGGNLATTQNDKANFRSAAKKDGLKFQERFAFDTLWNGLSIKIDPRDLSKLSRIQGVKALYPVETVAMPEPRNSGMTPELFTAIEMTGADIAQDTLGFKGTGIKVAIMDTGIDYDHPDLGGCFGPGCRVAYGWDFVGDDFDARDDNPSIVPDDNPDDCGGHGTHVAGIVGANGAVKGVAPDVTFGAYRVFGCVGSTTADIMIAAMERALADGMQVLNMSIGSSYQWPQYPTAQASDRLVNKGMVVVASIGNSGASGLYSAGAPGLGKKVIGTASFDNTSSVYAIFTVNGTDIGYNPMSFSAPVPTSGSEEITYVGRACNGDPLESDPTGKTALIVRGACTFAQKAANAINAGAVAVVIHNSSPGNFGGTLGGPISDSVPVVSISLEQGLYIRAQAAPVTMTWTDRIGSFPNPNGGLISSFSSYGLSPDLTLKPDIGAPGGNIFSTYPLESGGYAILGGTSMSSPHVAGAAALVLQAKPKTNSQVMRDILQNSADPRPWWGNPGLGFLDNVHRQGAGMVDVDDAITATTKVTPGKISAGEGEAGPYTQTLTIENASSEDVTYDLSYENALSTGGSIAPSFFLGSGSVAFSQASVTVPAGGTATVEATITPATGPSLGQYGGYIMLTPDGDGQSYSVPYAGFVGDYQAIQHLGRQFGLPFIVNEAPSYSMAGGDVPDFWVNLLHQPAKFRMEVFSAKGRSFHRAYDLRYLPRNEATNIIFSFPFDGTTFNGRRSQEVPDGDYYVVISVLKANGDDANPAHWESWQSPVFTIDRP